MTTDFTIGDATKYKAIIEGNSIKINDLEQFLKDWRALKEKTKQLEAVKTWSNDLTYSMTPEEWVEKIGDLNDILGFNDPTSKGSEA